MPPRGMPGYRRMTTSLASFVKRTILQTSSGRVHRNIFLADYAPTSNTHVTSTAFFSVSGHWVENKRVVCRAS
jgi:hypothetical protein